MGIEFATIGYEGASLEDFLATLKVAGVEILADVRELPVSRKKGFSKSALSSGAAAAGIMYVHFKDLGDPAEGRAAARNGDMDTFRRVYAAQIAKPSAKEALSDLEALCDRGVVCLLCYERDHKTCHRAIVAKKIQDSTGRKPFHLGVQIGLSDKTKSNQKDLAKVAAMA